MKTEVEKLEGNKVKLKVEVPSKVLDTALKDTYRDLAKRLYVPGFRKGKVPQKVIDAQIGKDTIVAQAAETIITSRYPEALVRSGVDPVEQPEVNVVQAEPGKDLVFEADVEVKPQAKLGDYKGVTVTLPDIDVDDEELEQQLTLLRERFARLEVVEGRAAEEGDYTLIDYRGTVDGEPFDGSTAEDYMIELGSGMLLQELEEGIVGMKRGESRTIEAKFSDDFRNKSVAGKTGAFDVKVKEIKQKILPDADDEFVSETTEHDTLQELKADLKRKLEVMKRAQTKVQAESKVLDAVTEQAEVEIPDKLLEMELDGMMDEFERNLKRQDATLEEYLKLTKSSKEKLREDLTPEAERRAKRELAIIAVAKAEKIQLERSEIEAEVLGVAKALDKPVAEVQRQIQAKGTLPELHASLLRRKTVDWLAANADVRTENGEPFDIAPPPSDLAPPQEAAGEAATDDATPGEEVLKMQVSDIDAPDESNVEQEEGEPSE